jgi:hypothetical protein
MSKKKIISQTYLSIFSEMKQFDARIYLFTSDGSCKSKTPDYQRPKTKKKPTHQLKQQLLVIAKDHG